MFATIEWRFFIDTVSKEKAQKIIDDLSNKIGAITIISLEHYWKDKSKYDLTCSTPLQIEQPEDAVFQVLLLAGQLGNEITVMGPRIVEAKQVEFEGICSTPKMKGIYWFHFEINNFS
ncbi:hypothetical protein QMA09_09250 [Planococcus sp. APC 3906]|uniref:hypothetical protein n=1 Tax=Planococcus sp. APC 3906 TaxID=3035194 RepID=UPI0025B3302A|nr:hypothetical protein [Planococcus sp. APC 3906]MDN3450377.1 hypothetical protein [Planococcus sp. APC 3906]